MLFIYGLLKQNKILLLSVCGIAATSAYALNILQPVAGIIADRYIFIANLFFCLLVIYLISISVIFFRIAKYNSVINFVLITVLATLSFNRVNAWKNFKTLINTDAPKLYNSYEAMRIAAGAYFEEYKKPRPGFTTPFCFKAFLKKSDNNVLRHFSSSIPDVADFFDKPELLIFNPKCDLIPDLDHIIGDNLSRFPVHLQGADDAELRRQLVGAIDEVKKKVRTNYKIAVPQYYDSKIQLLLPLCLTSGSPNPDLALVVHKLNDKTYTARTCLTLKMAYNNARLIVKPQSSWLKP